MGTRRDDVLLLGKCDDIVKELAKELGWLEELKAVWAETRTSLDSPPPADEESEEEPEQPEDEVDQTEETEDDRLQREINSLAKSVDDALRITDDLKERVGKELKETKEDVARAVRLTGRKDVAEEGKLKTDESHL